MTKWRWMFGFGCLLIPAYFGYIGYLETRVNTPFDAKKVCDWLNLVLFYGFFSFFVWFLRWFNIVHTNLRNDIGDRIVHKAILDWKHGIQIHW